MAYINKRDRQNVITKITIQFGTKLNCPEDSDAEITLREPDEMEILEWAEAKRQGALVAMRFFKQLMPSLVVWHNLMEDETEKMTNEDVVELIFSKQDAANYVSSEWSKAVFHTPQNSTGEK